MVRTKTIVLSWLQLVNQILIGGYIVHSHKFGMGISTDNTKLSELEGGALKNFVLGQVCIVLIGDLTQLPPIQAEILWV